MKIELKFKNIVDNPKCVIMLDQQVLDTGTVKENYEFDIDCVEETHILKILHTDKKPNETIVEHGVIVRDRSFELEKIVLDGYNIEELIWDSEFVADDGTIFPSCLFFGPNGQYQLTFFTPVLKWIIKHRAEKNSDTTWEEDYNYYMQAWKLLKQI